MQELNGGKADAEIVDLISKAKARLSQTCSKVSYKIIETENAKDFFVGDDIKSYANGSNEIAVFILTLGVEVDKHIKRLEKLDKLEYVVFDKVASYYIEELADDLQDEIKEQLLKNNKFMLNRFSTGYGDYPLSVNKKIVEFLDGNRLGVFLTDKNMFIPSKTICGIVAAGDSKDYFNFCKTCNLGGECSHLKKGGRCFEQR